MDQLENITRAYSQTPWRKQWQIIGLVSLVLVLMAMIAGVYLSISAQATAVGRDIQTMQSTSIAVDRENEDLQSHLALILSSSEMEARADSLGFVAIPPDQIVYLNVPGYRRTPANYHGAFQRKECGRRTLHASRIYRIDLRMVSYPYQTMVFVSH